MPALCGPLFAAARDGRQQDLERLLAKGANPNSKNADGWPALVRAAMGGHADVVQALLRAGASLAQPDAHGSTALIWAAEHGKHGCVEILLPLPGVDTGWSSADSGNTALHLSAKQGQLQCAVLLVDAGADPAKQNKDGKTPLDLARETGNAKVASFLSGDDSRRQAKAKAAAAEAELAKQQALAEKQAALEEELKQLQKWHECGLITEVVWQEWQRSLHGDKTRGADLPGEARGMLGP